MLPITLDSAGRQSTNPHNWDFKLRVINEGDSTELRISFDENNNLAQSNLHDEIILLDGPIEPLID